ncbi:GNAT family N-acetyltransferase [Delftia tsuruhatensis]|uniref:GNAT family N-acetyltransferase n=1 Tax=Delftia tsuruhatensis TaxID=180282 RepID=UPI0020900318|nr:GNAT family N-acetyltransferase [Delftia tsuruhatensis]MCO5337241.1 GNAT family N-acetyltransferase [Delftia tsuruhatensis]MCR4545966.1 GNAT family N-acetyltransferase [Delftia tsuruhatensis]
MAETAIITRVLDSVQQLDAQAWNALLASQAAPTPFMRHEYLSALESSGSAVPQTGWAARVVTLWQGGELVAACPVYAKAHSYGEYVFDFAWARAYAQHGLDYYPKGVLAVPFTPVPGSRLLARTPLLRAALVRAVREWAQAQQLSSLHLLFSDAEDLAACDADGWMQRSTVQFHWSNQNAGGAGHRDFDHFLSTLNQEKRKKIRQERRKVHEAGVRFRAVHGPDMSSQDWAFFYRCHERTYLEHGNAPYLQPAFFEAMAHQMPENWLMFVAERDGQPMACSLIALDAAAARLSAGSCDRDTPQIPHIPQGTAYGRYWGALERVDCLHFEACYYQPIAWCIERGIAHFEGGAQGEHKMARALLPVVTPSAHWIAHPSFADAISRFLDREGEGMAGYLQELQAHSPLRQD